MAQTQTLCLGIDLGTTFSSIAYYDINKKETVIVKLQNNADSIPSWVSISQLKDGHTFVGYDAKNDINSDSIAYDAKKMLGRKYIDIKEDIENWSFVVDKIKKNEEEYPVFALLNPQTSQPEQFAPEEISAILLTYFQKVLADQFPNAAIGNIVLTVPPSFTPLQKKATEMAAKIVGLKNFQLLNEPTAAILEYQRTHPNDLKINDKILVIDFGGGTLDICCCQIQAQGVIKIIQNGGNPKLGGNNFDDAMMELIKEKLFDNNGDLLNQKQDQDEEDEFAEEEEEKNYYFDGIDESILNLTDLSLKKKRLNRLKKEAERIKIALSKNDSLEVDMKSLLGEDFNEDEMVGFDITREEFEEKCEEKGLYDDFKETLKKITNKAKFNRGNTNLILLIGGTCMIPSVRDVIFKLFNKKNLADEKFDPLTAVAKGGSFKAFSNSSAVQQISVEDVVGVAVGVETRGGKFDAFFKSGDKIPGESKKEFITTTDNQIKAEFSIYSGEGEYIEDMGMDFVDRLIVDNLPPKPKGEVHFEVNMKMNTDGLIELSANIKGEESNNTGLKARMNMEKTDEDTKILNDHVSDFWIV